MVMPLFVGRPKSIRSLEEAMENNKQLLLVSQRKPDIEEPKIADLYKIGTLVNIIQLLKLPDGTVKVLVEGQQRTKLIDLQDNGEFFLASHELIETQWSDEKELSVLKKITLSEFEKYANLNKKIPADIISALRRINDIEIK